MDMDISTMDGSCHCGTVRFRVRLTNGSHTARRCTYSYCRTRGAIAVSAELGGVEFLCGAETLSVYGYGKGWALSISTPLSSTTASTTQRTTFPRSLALLDIWSSLPHALRR